MRNRNISLKLINALQNSKGIMIPVGNRNYLVGNLTVLLTMETSPGKSTGVGPPRCFHYVVPKPCALLLPQGLALCGALLKVSLGQARAG